MDPRMDKNENLVLDILRRHKGKKRAITFTTIAAETGITERSVRSIVNRLINEFRVPVCSSYDADLPGYYMAETVAEVDETYNKLRKHGVNILRRAAAVKNITYPALLGQLRLDLQEIKP